MIYGLAMLCIKVADCSFDSIVAISYRLDTSLFCLLSFGIIMRYDRSLPLNLTTCPYFCNFVMSWSPTLTTS